MTGVTFEAATRPIVGSRIDYAHFPDQGNRGVRWHAFDDVAIPMEQRSQFLVSYGVGYSFDPVSVAALERNMLLEHIRYILQTFYDFGVPLKVRVRVDEDEFSARRRSITLHADSIAVMHRLELQRVHRAEHSYEWNLDHSPKPLDMLAAIPDRIRRIAEVRVADLNFAMTGTQTDFDLFAAAVAKVHPEEFQLAARDSRYEPALIDWDAVDIEPLAQRAAVEVLRLA